MEVLIIKPLTRLERLAQIENLIIEAEKFGFADIHISIHKNQISNVTSSLNRVAQFGNCLSEMYTS